MADEGRPRGGGGGGGGGGAGGASGSGSEDGEGGPPKDFLRAGGGSSANAARRGVLREEKRRERRQRAYGSQGLHKNPTEDELNATGPAGQRKRRGREEKQRLQVRETRYWAPYVEVA
jgi:hypothetical protein